MWIGLGLNLGLHAARPATNCLSHGMHLAQEQFGVNDKSSSCMQTEDKRQWLHEVVTKKIRMFIRKVLHFQRSHAKDLVQHVPCLEQYMITINGAQIEENFSVKHNEICCHRLQCFHFRAECKYCMYNNNNLFAGITFKLCQWYDLWTHLEGLLILQCLFVSSQVPQGRCSQASVRLLDTCQLIDSLDHCLDVIFNTLDALCILALALKQVTPIIFSCS